MGEVSRIRREAFVESERLRPDWTTKSLHSSVLRETETSAEGRIDTAFGSETVNPDTDILLEMSYQEAAKNEFKSRLKHFQTKLKKRTKRDVGDNAPGFKLRSYRAEFVSKKAEQKSALAIQTEKIQEVEKKINRWSGFIARRIVYTATERREDIDALASGDMQLLRNDIELDKLDELIQEEEDKQRAEKTEAENKERARDQRIESLEIQTAALTERVDTHDRRLSEHEKRYEQMEALLRKAIETNNGTAENASQVMTMLKMMTESKNTHAQQNADNGRVRKKSKVNKLPTNTGLGNALGVHSFYSQVKNHLHL